MKLCYIGLFSLFALINYALTEKVSYKNYKVYKITPKNEEALKALKDFENGSSDFSPYQFWQGPTVVGHEVTLMVAPQLKDSIESMSESLDVDVRVMIDDVQKKIDAENPLRTLAPYSVNWTAYNTLDEINAWLEQLEIDYPNAITVLRPGKSHQGRDIVGVRLDLTPNVEKEVVFMESNIHAREWITAATSTWILDQFLRSEDASVRELAARYTWYFFPVMNPDGYVYSHETDRMWRKTRTRYNIFCYGADPNRNWGYQWMNGGASSNPCSDIYAGPRPFSEPSVEVMRNFITSIASNMVAYLDFHSFSQMLLLPYGHTTDPLDNYNEMMAIGNIAIANLTALYQTAYRIGNIAETIYGNVMRMVPRIGKTNGITAATSTWILDQFLRSEDASVRELAARYTWYFFPVMNPDGYVYSHETDRMWRKTRTRYNIFCYGADPNRNWGYQWMNGGASSNPCSDIYAGPRPFSEPSVEVMRNFITSIASNMVAYLDFHSFSQMLLLPYGHTTDPLDNYNEMMAIGNIAIANLTALYQTAYRIGNIAETIYIAAGSSMDWVKGTFNTSIAYTYELRDTGEHGFNLPAEQIVPTAEETLVSIISIFEEWNKLHPTN